jgi:hypothetical protein
MAFFLLRKTPIFYSMDKFKEYRHKIGENSEKF